jgi:RimJ/RimL family protein N-acetyltransferase
MLTSAEIARRPHPPYPPYIRGNGLELVPWSRELVTQMAGWSEHGFPYSAFDLSYLRDPLRASSTLTWTREDGKHRHFVAIEGGRAVGRVSVNLEDDVGLYLWAVHVPPEHEGKGICRRMLATIMVWLEEQCPGLRFSLTTNAFAKRAHRAYFALGFSIADTRWVHDEAVATGLFRANAAARRSVQEYVRFRQGAWQTRSYLMIREAGTPILVRQPTP